MRSRDVVGKRIVAVHQERVTDELKRQVYAVQSLELDNGARIYFSPILMQNGYEIEGHVQKAPLKDAAIKKLPTEEVNLLLIYRETFVQVPFGTDRIKKWWEVHVPGVETPLATVDFTPYPKIAQKRFEKQYLDGRKYIEDKELGNWVPTFKWTVEGWPKKGGV